MGVVGVLFLSLGAATGRSIDGPGRRGDKVKTASAPAIAGASATAMKLWNR
jgi:hypothetical protein